MLCESGSQLSWLTILPKLKIDQEGDVVRNAADVYFKVSDRSNEYLHCSSKTVEDTDDKLKEINCSLERSAWHLMMYDTFPSAADEVMLRCNDIVYLTDPEAHAYLRLAAPVSFTGETDYEGGTLKRRASTLGEEAPPPGAGARDAYLEPFFSTNDVDSNCMWLVEQKVPTQGGKLQYGEVQYRFRHLNSHMYLASAPKSRWKKSVAVISSLQGNSNKHREEQEFKFVSYDNADDSNTLFTFHSARHRTSLGDNSIPKNSAMVIESNNGRFIKRGSYNYNLMPNKAVFDTSGVSKRGNALAMIINKVDDAKRDDAAYGVDSLPVLVDFKRAYMNKEWSTVSHLVDDVVDNLDQLTNFTIRRAIDEELMYGMLDLQHLSSSSNKVEEEKELVKSRQKLLREQNILDCCMQLLKQFALFREQLPLLKLTRDQEKLIKNCNDTIGKCCFWLIFCAMFENPKNQMHIANNLAIILKHVSTSTLATRCVVEMLGSNMELQEEKVTKNEIKIFIDLINSSKMNCNYLNLLRATCNCAGDGVDGNQGLVVEYFMQKKSNLTIKLCLDPVEKKECKWTEIPEFGADGSTDGHELKKDGIPAITVRWSDTFKDFSPIHLYAKSVVPLKEVVEILDDVDVVNAVRAKGGNAADMIEEARQKEKDDKNGGGSSKNSSRASVRGMRASMSGRNFRKTGTRGSTGNFGTGDVSMIQLRKMMVAEYFVSQIYLYAETCLDRNYIAMEYLAELMPYEMLLCIVRDATLPDEFKAAIARLVNCLYVDAYPQNMVRLPTLTRVWNRINPDVPAPLPAVEKERDTKFAFLQEAVTEHLESLVGGGGWNVFTRRLMESLMLMVKFRFYTTPAQVKYIVTPLLNSLDRRKSEADEGTDGRSTPSGGKAKRAQYMKKIAPEGSAAPSPPWQKGVLVMMQSTRWLFAILALVAVCLVVNGVQIANNYSGIGWDVFDYVTFAAFAVELLVRMHCWKRVKTGSAGFANPIFTRSFFKDKYHNLDIGVVLLDVFLMVLDSVGDSVGSAGGFAKGLRSLRVMKLARILRAARIVNGLAVKEERQHPHWHLAKRFRTTPEDQLSTMVEMVKALAEITRLSQDYSVSTAMNAFKRYFKGETGVQTPSEIFSDIVESCNELQLDATGELENVFVDLCSYDYPDLVQNSLQVLMVHHSTRQILLDNLHQVQLLTTIAEESLHDRLRAKLKLLEEHAEKSELWVEFESPRDFEICDEVQQILAQLTDEIRTDTETLEFGGDETANEDIQNVLRNLGAFEVAATVLELAGELDDDEEEEEEESSDEEEDEDTLLEGNEDEDESDGGKAKNAGSVGSAGEETKSKKVKEILLLCNTFLTWFVRDNAENQLLAFQNLELLQETIDAGIDSTRVIAQIFRKNEQLMKEFPVGLVTEFAEKIATNGRKPDYLDLIESIVSFPDFNLLSHQLVIVQEFASSVRQEKLLYLCQSSDSLEYAERQRMMDIKAKIIRPDMDSLDDDDDHAREMLVPAGETAPLLRYHTKLLNILAGCAVGRANITTVEAKIQSLYNYDDVLHGISDPRTHIDIKIALLNLFYEAYIEVEIKIGNLSHSKALWNVLKCISQPPQEMSHALLSGDVSLEEMRKLMHFIHLSAKVMDGFLEHYYEGTEFRNDDKTSHIEEGDETKIEEDPEEKEAEGGVHWVDKCFVNFYNSIKELYDLKSPMVTAEQNTSLYRCMDSIAMSCDQLAPHDLPIHVDLLLGTDDDDENDRGGKEDEPGALARFIKALDADEDLIDQIRQDRTEHMVSLINALPRQGDDVLDEVRYEPTIRKLVSHIRNLIKKDKNRKWIERENVDTAIWVIQLFRAMIEMKWTESFREREGPDADRMGIDERDDDGEEEEDVAAGPVQDTLDSCGATTLCLDVIAEGMNENVVEEAVKLMIALLFREGGNKVTQASIHDHLNERGTDAFFEEIRNRIQKMKEWHTFKVVEQEDEAKEKMRPTGSVSGGDSGGDDDGFSEGDEIMAQRTKGGGMSGMASKKWSEEKFKATVEKVNETEKNGELSTTYDIKYVVDGIVATAVDAQYLEAEEEDVDEPDGIILIRAIQLMSEGHFEGNQDMTRDQPNNSKTYNLLDDFVDYLAFLSKNISPESTNAANMVAGTILEVIQGPCVGNQKHLAMNTELIEILNRMMRSKPGPDADEEEEDELKKCGLEIFEALLEGQGKGSEIYERILSVIHLDVLQVMACAGAGEDVGAAGDDGDDDEGSVLDDEEEGEGKGEEEDEGLGDVQTEALVLMQMLCDYRPAIKDEFEWPPEIEEKLGTEIVSVEVVWHGNLQRRFFPIPEMCHDLAEVSKAKFVEFVDRESNEIKLVSLMEESKTMYIEIKHQQYLKELGIAGVFSPGNQQMATNFSFMFCCIINFFLLYGYEWGEPETEFDNVYLNVNADWNTFYVESQPESTATATTDFIASLKNETLRPKDPALVGGIDNVVTIFNFFQCFTALFVFVLFLVVKCPVRYNVALEHGGMNEFQALMYTGLDNMTLYYFGYLIVATVCLWGGRMNQFGCFLLMDIIVKDSTTKDVLNAVIYPFRQLAMTVLLMLFSINIFSTLIFFNYHDEFNNGDLKECETMTDCFVATLNYGLRSSGGIGDQMQFTLGQRWVLDLLYFLMILIILLTVVSGIIIDTFSELRSKKMDRLDDTFKTCFICGLDDVTFDRAYDAVDGFKRHFHNDHNMWNYVFFMVFIWEQDRDDDDGMELYVRNMMTNLDVGWFPMNRAMILVTDDKVEDTVSEKIENLKNEFEEIMTLQNAIMIKTSDKSFGGLQKKVDVVARRMDQTFFEIKDSMNKGGGVALVGKDQGGGKGASKYDSNAGFSFVGDRVQTPQGMESIPRVGGGLNGEGILNQFGIDDYNLDDASVESEDSIKMVNKRVTMLMKPPPGSRYAKVAVLGAQDLAAPHLFGTSDPFIVAQVFWNDEKVGETDTVWMTQQPKWENTKTNSFQCPLWGTEPQNTKMAKLKVCLYHAHRRGLGHFLGQVELNWKQLQDMKGGAATNIRLQKKATANKASQRMVQGEVRVAVAFS